MGRQYKTKKASIKERYKVAQHLHERLKRIVDDVSNKFGQLTREPWCNVEVDKSLAVQGDLGLIPATLKCFFPSWA